MSALCRLCLNERDSLNNIFESVIENLPEKVFKCTAVQILKEDGLPPFVCMDCTQMLTEFDSFRKQCQYSDKVLKERLNLLSCDECISSNKYNSNDNTKLSNSTSIQENDQRILDDSESNLISRKKYGENNAKNSKINIKYKNIFKNRALKVYKIDESIREIIGENTYVCDVCDTNFSSFFDCYDHQATHNGNWVFKCDKCDKIFSHRQDLLSHDKHHKLKCKICELEVLPKSMPAHALIHTDIHKCAECGMRHTSRASLEKHIKARHAGIKGFVCHICGKQSSCQSSLNRHMGYHSNERPYKCKYCSFCAKSLNIVQVHTSRKHFAEKCVCEVCAKLFKSQPSLIQHMKRIHAGRKFECSICSKNFGEKYNLNRHMKRHAQHELYECKLCHWKFLTVRLLKQHMHSHRQGCVKCPNCSKEFFYKKHFNNHVTKCSDISTTKKEMVLL